MIFFIFIFIDSPFNHQIWTTFHRAEYSFLGVKNRRIDFFVGGMYAQRLYLAYDFVIILSS